MFLTLLKVGLVFFFGCVCKGPHNNWGKPNPCGCGDAGIRKPSCLVVGAVESTAETLHHIDPSVHGETPFSAGFGAESSILGSLDGTQLNAEKNFGGLEQVSRNDLKEKFNIGRRIWGAVSQEKARDHAALQK